MHRAERLIALLQSFRNRRNPVSAKTLAEELEVSDRTIYRDIDLLRQQGAGIVGEPGFGYLMKDGFWLPPLNFNEAEVDAILLGLAFTFNRGDEAMQRTARDATAKLTAVLPKRLTPDNRTAQLINGPPGFDGDLGHLDLLRRSMSTERRVLIRYNKGGEIHPRVVWPIAVAFMSGTNLLAAWCELRSAFRHFRIDRIMSAELLDSRFGRSRERLVREWQKIEPVTSQLTH